MAGRQLTKRNVISFLVALAVGVILGTVVQTQLNLWALQAMGVAVGLDARISATGHDLVSFAPLYLLLFGLVFVPNQRAWPPQHLSMCMCMCMCISMSMSISISMSCMHVCTRA